jgi:Ku protein
MTPLPQPFYSSSRAFSSNLLHKKDHSRIRYQRVSEATGEEVPAKEIVRGFEVERNNFVVIPDDELKEAAPEKSAAIEIQEFVNQSQIPTLYFEKSYYLEPNKGADKAYVLLSEALAKSGKNRHRAIRAAQPLLFILFIQWERCCRFAVPPNAMPGALALPDRNPEFGDRRLMPVFDLA